MIFWSSYRKNKINGVRWVGFRGFCGIEEFEHKKYVVPALDPNVDPWAMFYIKGNPIYHNYGIGIDNSVMYNVDNSVIYNGSIYIVVLRDWSNKYKFMIGDFECDLGLSLSTKKMMDLVLDKHNKNLINTSRSNI